MNLIHDTELSLFTEVPEDKELNILYDLNQQNTPEVGELESINDLSKLIDMSAINFYVLAGDEIIGFVICFREGSEYKSPNYTYFKNKEGKFLYIDRIAIKDIYRHQGIGKKIYEQVFNKANELGLPVVCEVNTKPLNEPSLKFHRKLGFTECGTNEFSYNSVVYLKKE